MAAKLTTDDIKWNTDVIGFKAGEYEYDLKKFDEHHYRLMLPKDRLDYWPNTGRARWLKTPNNFFVIKNIESFINKQYKHA